MSATERDPRVETEVVAVLREVSPNIDELQRARLASAIDAALDAEDRIGAARRDGTVQATSARLRWRIFAVAAVAAVALVIALRPHGERTPMPVPASGGVAVTPSANGSVAQPRPEPDPDPVRRPAALAPSTSLVALRGERARATVGTRVRLTLVGEGRVTVLAVARDGDIELALHAGRLLVDYDGRAGGTLRVRSPGALTTVVGTLFAIEVSGAGSRVAVARGTVRTESTSGRDAEIIAGSSWTSANGHSAPIPADLALALTDHQAIWAQPATQGDLDEAADRPQPARRPAARPARHAEDLDALYTKAEAAMRERSPGEARRLLETIVARDPRGPLREAALLDLARLALTDGDRAEALRALGRLPTPLRDPALAETAEHLRARAQQAGP